MTIQEASQKIRSGELSPVELTQAAIASIVRLQPYLNAFVTITESFALEQARQAEKEIWAGRYRGPLHGIPYAAKDLYYTQGIRTTMGSKIMADFVPDHDATVIKKLHTAGAVLVGKAGLHEWAYGITSTNPHFGAVRNPWALDRIPGGSSGGSTAALASGQCLFSLGSDTGGSIRIPASLCGVVGLKPTFGRVSRHGVFPLSHTLDHTGAFGLTTRDTAWIYETIAGVDVHDDSSVDRPNPTPLLDDTHRLDGKRIGIPRNFYFDQLDPDVDAAVHVAIKTMEEIGATLVEIEVPDIGEFNAVARLIQLAEASSVHRRRLREQPEDFGDDVRVLLEQGLFISATDYLDAQRRRRELNRGFNDLLQQVDVIVVPTIPITAAKIGQMTTTIGDTEENVRLATTRLVRALNLTGLPLLSVPCGLSLEGLPIGLQLIGPLFGEAGLLEIGHAYERVTDWHSKKPPSPDRTNKT